MSSAPGQSVAVGDIVMAHFPAHVPPGHEQQGYRPAIVVGLPQTLGRPRFPTVFVTPLTTARVQDWAGLSPDLYLRLEAGTGGIPVSSIMLLDQTRSIDMDRIARYVGSLPEPAYQRVEDRLRRLFSKVAPSSLR